MYVVRCLGSELKVLLFRPRHTKCQCGLGYDQTTNSTCILRRCTHNMHYNAKTTNATQNKVFTRLYYTIQPNISVVRHENYSRRSSLSMSLLLVAIVRDQVNVITTLAFRPSQLGCIQTWLALTSNFRTERLSQCNVLRRSRLSVIVNSFPARQH